MCFVKSRGTFYAISDKEIEKILSGIMGYLEDDVDFDQMDTIARQMRRNLYGSTIYKALQDEIEAIGKRVDAPNPRTTWHYDLKEKNGVTILTTVGMEFQPATLSSVLYQPFSSPSSAA